MVKKDLDKIDEIIKIYLVLYITEINKVNVIYFLTGNVQCRWWNYRGFPFYDGKKDKFFKIYKSEQYNKIQW